MSQSPDCAWLRGFLEKLRLGYVAGNYEELAKQAVAKRWSHATFLEHLIEGECLERQHRTVERLIRQARFQVVKTLGDFDWSWPEKIDEGQVRNLFDLGFIEKKSNVVFMGTVGTGKTHLLTALSYHACQQGHSVLYTTAIEALTRLLAAKAVHRVRSELRLYLKPSVLAIDELGCLPLDKAGADLVFQLISQRYEQGSLVITTNKEYPQWVPPRRDAGLTSAVLDRVLHHVDTVTIEGKSYRMKDQSEAAS